MTLRIERAQLDEMREHGEQTYPHECCGALVGDLNGAGDKTVKSVVRCGNTRTDSPRNRYGIEASELIRIQRDAALAGQSIIGFYHSHPDCPAKWSATDLKEAHWTGCSYVITSVENGRASMTNSFLLVGAERGKHFEEEAIDVNDSAQAEP